MVFYVKQNLQRKYQLVAGVHLINIMNIPVYFSTVNNIIVNILHVISKKGIHEAPLWLYWGFLNSRKNEKVLCKDENHNSENMNVNL